MRFHYQRWVRQWFQQARTQKPNNVMVLLQNSMVFSCFDYVLNMCVCPCIEAHLLRMGPEDQTVWHSWLPLCFFVGFLSAKAELCYFNDMWCINVCPCACVCMCLLVQSCMVMWFFGLQCAPPLLSAALKQNSCLGCFASSCFQIVLPLSYYMFTTTALSRPARC